MNEDNSNINGTAFGSEDIPLVDNPFNESISNNSLYGVSRYLDSLASRVESDPITGFTYRAKDVYQKFPTINELNSDSNNDHITQHNIFHKILGSDNINTNNEVNINDLNVSNPQIASLKAEPNFVRRFVSGATGVNLRDRTTNSVVTPGLLSSSISLSRNLNITSGANPAVVNALKQDIYEGTHGYSLRGFSSRFNIANSSPSPIIIGAAVEALETSLMHRSTKEVLQGALGFQSRPDSAFYQRLFTGPVLGDESDSNSVYVNATFFQFQNTEVLQSLFRPGISFNLITQRMDAESFRQSNSTRVGILAGNELVLNATETLASDTVLGQKQSMGVNYHNSFHPKVGYVTINRGANDQYGIAFIGTQNITSATSRHSTIESMLFVRSDSNLALEKSLYQQIEYLQKELMPRLVSDLNKGYNSLQNLPENEKIAGQKLLYDNATATLRLGLNEKANNINSSVNLYFNNEIFGHQYMRRDSIIDNQKSEGAYTKLLSNTLNNKNLIAVLSFDYINNLIDSDGNKHRFIYLVEKLIETKQIQVVMSAAEYQKAMNNLDSSVDKQLLTKLSQAGALNLAVTGKHHDKSIAVFEKGTHKLRALALGSANPTRTSMGLARGDVNNGGNIEVAAVIGLNNLTTINELEDEYLSSLNVGSHYFGLTAGAVGINLNNNSLNISKPLLKAYKTESPALLLVKEQERISQIIRLKEAINNYTQTGSDPYSKYGSIIATLRYEPQLRNKFNYGGISNIIPTGMNSMAYSEAPVGLRITITGPDRSHKLTFDASVTEEGNIIIPDLNKILNGSVFVNKSNAPITLFSKAPSTDNNFIRKRVLNPGDLGTVLTPFETLLAFTETVQRSFIYQEEFGLVDLTFRDSVASNQHLVLEKIKSLFEDAFNATLPNNFGLTSDGSTTVNLKTILASLAIKSRSAEANEARLSILNQVAEYMTSKSYGDSTINRASKDAEIRKKAIFESLIDSLNFNVNDPTSSLMLDDRVASKFLRKLLITNSHYLNDFKKELINKMEYSRARYKSASLTQARTLLDELLSSYLAVHEETYAYYQGQERLSIFGETSTFDLFTDDAVIKAQYSAGLLNPLPISHSTQVTSAGVLYRSLASTSYGNTLMLPAFGGLKQLSVIDSDLSSGASVGQSFLDGMVKSSPGFALVDINVVHENTRLMLEKLKDFSSKELENALAENLATIQLAFGSSTKLIYTPFDKLEQLTQRIKNIVGYRPALEFNPRFAESLLKLFDDPKLYNYFNINQTTDSNLTEFIDYLSNYNPVDPQLNQSILDGKLRFSMPQTQFEEVKKVKALLKDQLNGKEPTYEQVQEYFRRAMLKQGNVQHGFIGGTKYRRFALTLGTSFMGDFSYLNAGYTYRNSDSDLDLAQIYGKQHNLRIKFNPDRVDNVLSTITEFIKLFGEGGAVAITEHFTRDGKTYTPGLYKVNKLGDLTRGSDNSFERIGDFTSTGLIKLDINLVKVHHKGNYGSRPEPILIKVPAFARRSEGGITFIAPSPHLVDTARTTNIIELDTYTIFRPGTSSRIGGGGLKKSPVVFLSDNVFNRLENNIGQPSTLPTMYKSDRLYGLGSINTFKGVNFETGQVLLSDQSFRKNITSDKNKESLLITLASLFTSDIEIKSSLINYLKDKNKLRSAASLLSTKGISIMSQGVPSLGKINADKSLSTLSLTSSGLLMLGGENAVKSLDFNFLKEDILKALNNGSDEEYSNLLLNRFKSLLDIATDRAISYSDSEFLTFNDSDPFARAAGLVAHLFYFTSQLFNEQRQTVSGLYEIGLDGDNARQLYKGDILDIHGYTTTTYRNFVHQTLRAMGYSPKSITEDDDISYNLELMQLAHSRLNQQVVIETLVDNQVSQSLVSSGMRDVVKQEYQFYMGMMNRKLNEYRNVMGEEGVTIQRAYLEAVAVSEGDLNAMVREQSLPFKLAMSAFVPKYVLDDFKKPGSLLRYQDLKLRDLALLYSPGIADSNIEDKYDQDFAAATLNILTATSVRQLESSLIYSSHLLHKHISAISEVTSSGYSKGLIKMATVLQNQLNMNVNNNTSEAIEYKSMLLESLDSLRNSQRIILPHIEFKLTDKGTYIAAMRPVSNHLPVTGILLGSDFVSRIGQSFGDFETEIMKSQVDLVESLIQAQPTLAKFLSIYQSGITSLPEFSEQEYNLILRLQEALKSSARTLIEIPVTDISRQYAGDHESMSGAVGIATNSFLLQPDEIILGSRYLRIAGVSDSKTGFSNKSSSVGDAIRGLVKKLIGNKVSSTSLESLSYLINTFGVADSSTISADYTSYLSNLSDDYVKSKLTKLGYSADFNSLDITKAKQILLSTKIYVDILGLSYETDYTDILKEVLLDHTPEDVYKNKNLNDIINSYGSNTLANFTLEKLAYLAAGFTFSRTGAPGGSSGLDNDVNEFRAIHLLQFKKRREALASGSLIELDDSRISTGVIVPSNSVLISGLGDYDGDSYRLTMKRIAANPYPETNDALRSLENEIHAIKNERYKLTQQKNKLESSLLFESNKFSKNLNKFSKNLNKFLTLQGDTRSINYLTQDSFRNKYVFTPQMDDTYYQTIRNKIIKVIGLDKDASDADIIRQYIQQQAIESNQTSKKSIDFGYFKLSYADFYNKSNPYLAHLSADSPNTLSYLIKNTQQNIYSYSIFSLLLDNLDNEDLSSMLDSNKKFRQYIETYKNSDAYLYLSSKDINNRLNTLVSQLPEDYLNVFLDFLANNQIEASVVKNKLYISGNTSIVKPSTNNIALDKYNEYLNKYLQFNLAAIDSNRIGSAELPESNIFSQTNITDTRNTLSILGSLLHSFNSDERKNIFLNSTLLYGYDENAIAVPSSKQDSLTVRTSVNELIKAITTLSGDLDSSSYDTSSIDSLKNLVAKNKNKLEIKSKTLVDLLDLADNYYEDTKSTNINNLAPIKNYLNILTIINSLTSKLKYNSIDNSITSKAVIYNRVYSGISKSILDIESIAGDLPDINTLNRTLDDINQDINIRSQIKDLNVNIRAKSSLLKTKEQEFDEYTHAATIYNLTAEERYYRKIEARKLKATERFIKSYTNLPSFMFGSVAGLGEFNSGELINMISQKYDFGNIQDAEPYSKMALYETILALALQNEDVIDSSIFSRNIGSINLSNNQKTIIKQTIGVNIDTASYETILKKMKIVDADKNLDERAALLHLSVIQELVNQKKRERGISSLNFIDAHTLMQEVGQQRQAIDVINKKPIGRQLNTLLTPEEFNASISIIGLGGTDLIGRAYNTLIPLLDTIIIEQSFMYAHISEDLDIALNTEEYQDLRSSLGIGKENVGNKIKIRNRYAGVLSVLSNFQQIVRDALKAKEGGSILTKFHEYSNYDGQISSLLSALSAVPEDHESSISVDNRIRTVMAQFLKSSMGPEIGNSLFLAPNADVADVNIFSSILDVNEAVTGFGALYYLDSYVRTESNENFYEKFITANAIFGDQSQYFEKWAEHSVSGMLGYEDVLNSIKEGKTNWANAEYQHIIKHFISEQIINLMQRTQVSFSLSSLKEDNVNLVADRLKNIVSYFESNIEKDSRYSEILSSPDKISSLSTTELKELLGLSNDSNLSIYDSVTGTEYRSINEDVPDIHLLDKQYALENQNEIAEQFKQQYRIYKTYEQLLAQEGSDKDKLNMSLVGGVMLAQMQYRDTNYKVLDVTTIDYLRQAALDLSTFTNEDMDALNPEDKVKLASRVAYNQMMRGLRSGKITDNATALEASQFRLSNILHVLHENNIDVSYLLGGSDNDETITQLNQLLDNYHTTGIESVDGDTAVPENVLKARSKLNLASILTGLVQTTGLDAESSSKLLRFMVAEHTITKNDKERTVTGFQLIAEQSAGLAVIEKLVLEREKYYEVGNITMGEAIDARLAEYSSTDASNLNLFNNPVLLDINDYDLDSALAQEAEDNVQKIIAETQDNILNQNYQETQKRLSIMQSAPIAGILAGPLLFALASSDLELDERVGMFAYDVLQGAAELSNRPNTMYSQYVGTTPHSAHGFRMSRVKQSMLNYGVGYGAAIGFSSELIYKGLGEVSDAVINSTISRKAKLNPTLGTVGLAAASEILAAVLSQAVTRTITRKIHKKVSQQQAEEINYTALKQQLSAQILEYQIAQQRQDEINANDIDNNLRAVIEYDDKSFTPFNDNDINRETGLDIVLIGSGGNEVSVNSDDFNDPNYSYISASDYKDMAEV